MYQTQTAPDSGVPQTTLSGQSAPAILIQNVPYAGTSNKREGYAAKQSIGLGATQITIGILCFILQIAGIVMQADKYYVGQGIWGGLFFILTGSFGVAAGKGKTTCTIVTHMVLSIVAAVLSVSALGTSAGGVVADTFNHYGYYSHYGYYGHDYTDYNWDPSAQPPADYQIPQYHNDNATRDKKLAVNSMLIIFCFVEIVIAIWASAISCGAVCCGPPLRPTSVGAIQVQYIPATGADGNAQLVIINSSGQAMGQISPQYPHPIFIQQASSAQASQVPASCDSYLTKPPPYPQNDTPPDYSSPDLRYVP